MNKKKGYLINRTEMKLLIIPSNENKSKELSPTEIVEFNLLINSENEISELIIDEPISRILSVKR